LGEEKKVEEKIVLRVFHVVEVLGSTRFGKKVLGGVIFLRLFL